MVTAPAIGSDEELEAELNKPSPYESAIERIEQTLRDVSGTSITSSSGVVDVLLDLRNDVEKLHEGMITAIRVMMSTHRTMYYYEENFGPVEVPEGWEPAWASDGEDGCDEEI